MYKNEVALLECCLQHEGAKRIRLPHIVVRFNFKLVSQLKHTENLFPPNVPEGGSGCVDQLPHKQDERA